MTEDPNSQSTHFSLSFWFVPALRCGACDDKDDDMYPVYRSRRHHGSEGDRSGGKMARKYTRTTISPYDRPLPPPPVSAPTSNWLTGVFLPKVVTGATLVSSFLFTPSTSPSSSSSSSSYSTSEQDTDVDSSLADGSENENDYHHLQNNETGCLIKENSLSEFEEDHRKESQLTVAKNETKHLIEKLIAQETFSREERDRLISKINSGVVESSTIDERLLTRSDIPDMCTKAIMEAKQWIEEKKEASISKLRPSNGTCKSNPGMLSPDNKGGLGTPVDIARAYMRDRPPWSSPLSLNPAGERTPSPVGRKVLMNEVPYGSSFSSSKRKISSLSSGSWNIQDEIRRVRSRATEEILKTVPSKKYIPFALEPEGIQNTSLNSRNGLDLEQKLHESELFSSVKSIDASADFMGTGVSTSGCLPASSVNATKVNFAAEDLQLQPVMLAGIRSVEDIQLVEEENHAAYGLHRSTQEPVANNYVSSSHDKLTGRDCCEETCQLLSESLVEIPCMNEIDNVATDNTLDNSIKHIVELSKVSTQSHLKRGVKGKSNTNAEKGPGRKSSRRLG